MSLTHSHKLGAAEEAQQSRMFGVLTEGQSPVRNTHIWHLKIASASSLRSGRIVYIHTDAHVHMNEE